MSSNNNNTTFFLYCLFAVCLFLHILILTFKLLAGYFEKSNWVMGDNMESLCVFISFFCTLAGAICTYNNEKKKTPEFTHTSLGEALFMANEEDISEKTPLLNNTETAGLYKRRRYDNHLFA